MATFHLKVLTVDKQFFDGEVDRIVVRTSQGDVGILPNHVPYVAALGVGDCPTLRAWSSWCAGSPPSRRKRGCACPAGGSSIDKVAAQNDIHPVGHRLLRPALHLRQAGDKIGVQLYVENLSKP